MVGLARLAGPLRPPFLVAGLARRGLSWLPGALVVVLVVGTIGAGLWRVYSAGKARGAAAAELKAARDDAEANRQLADSLGKALETTREITRLQAELIKTIETTRANTAAAVTTSREVIRANPAFAATARPPELDRLRRAQLDEIRRAAGAGGLPGGDGGVPAAGLVGVP